MKPTNPAHQAAAYLVDQGVDAADLDADRISEAVDLVVSPYAPKGFALGGAEILGRLDGPPVYMLLEVDVLGSEVPDRYVIGAPDLAVGDRVYRHLPATVTPREAQGDVLVACDMRSGRRHRLRHRTRQLCRFLAYAPGAGVETPFEVYRGPAELRLDL